MRFLEARVRVTKLLFGPPVIWPVSFRVVGPDPIKIRGIAHQVRNVMDINPHIYGSHLEWDERAPVLHLSVDNERLRLMGLTPTLLSRRSFNSMG